MDYKLLRKRHVLEILLIVMAFVAGCALVYMTVFGLKSMVLQLILGLVFTLSLLCFMWLWFDPDTHAAYQADELFKLAGQMLDCMKDGLTTNAAQQICELLLPATPALAVAITDRERILGYAGYNAANNQSGRAVRTRATRKTLEDGKPRILRHPDDIGLPMSSTDINAAIVQPLYVGNSIEGTVKFYYRNAKQLSKTQQSLVHGFAELLSTQMAATLLEEQVKLTTSMELKALQAQINPHFLFNTLNTIASLIRTDPAKARTLLRDFSAFYRSTLEDSEDLIPLERELKQTERYFSFETARFGEDRLQLIIDVDPEIMDIEVPSFMIQPLVENAVKHAMRTDKTLTITITGTAHGDDAILCVHDDGAGMSKEVAANMLTQESETGLGIAVKNVNDRIRGYFGPGSNMEVDSELGQGTEICFKLSGALSDDDEPERALEEHLNPE